MIWIVSPGSTDNKVQMEPINYHHPFAISLKSPCGLSSSITIQVTLQSIYGPIQPQAHVSPLELPSNDHYPDHNTKSIHLLNPLPASQQSPPKLQVKYPFGLPSNPKAQRDV
jgi:hypothetical protein